MTTFIAYEVFDALDRPIAHSSVGSIVPPTAEELAARDAKIEAAREAARANKAAAQPRLRAAMAALDALKGVERRVLDLHSRDKHNECEGCDWGAYAEGGADWPCSTVSLIAEHHGLDLSDMDLYDPDWDGAS